MLGNQYILIWGGQVLAKLLRIAPTRLRPACAQSDTCRTWPRPPPCTYSCCATSAIHCSNGHEFALLFFVRQLSVTGFLVFSREVAQTEIDLPSRVLSKIETCLLSDRLRHRQQWIGKPFRRQARTFILKAQRIDKPHSLNSILYSMPV